MKRIKIKKEKCERCGHKWVPHKKMIVVCPSCKSPYFDRPRKK